MDERDVPYSYSEIHLSKRFGPAMDSASLVVALNFDWSSPIAPRAARLYHDGMPSTRSIAAKEAFRDAIVASHFKADLSVTVGLEFEAGGLRIPEVVDILKARLGVTQSICQKSHWGMAHYLYGTEFGTIRVEPAAFHRFFNAIEGIGNTSFFRHHPILAGVVRCIERHITLFEIITEPLTLTQVEGFGRYSMSWPCWHQREKLSGSYRRRSMSDRSAGCCVDEEPSGNYYGNHAAIRRADAAGLDALLLYTADSPNFPQETNGCRLRPDPEELFAWYQRYNKWKHSSIELSYALLSWQANRRSWSEQVGRPNYPSRPAVEFREANTVTSTQKNPYKTSIQVMREVRFAVSMVEAARSREPFRGDESSCV